MSVPTSLSVWRYAPGKHEGVARVDIFLLATHVQDRFGNWVNYSYSGTHLVGIASSDGRSITVNWSGDAISSVTSSLGTWSYGYTTDSNGYPQLASVTRPDGSKWTYAIDSGSLVTTKNDYPDDYVPPNDHCQLFAIPNSGSFEYTIGAPSGAMATYSFTYGRFYRDKVPLGCNDGNPDHNYPQDATSYFDNFALISKQISGPGLVTQKWSYAYGGDAGSYYTASAPFVNGTEPYEPSGTCSACGVSKVVTVTGPVSITAYAYGTQYAVDEGQLLEKQVADLSGNVLRTTTYAPVTDVQAPGEPFADIAGYDLRPIVQDPMGNRNRPLIQTSVTEDGATFITTVSSFDAFARATGDTSQSNLGYSKTDTTSYFNDLNQWVLGLPTATATNGIPTTQMTYTSTDLPYRQYSFGRLVSTQTWNSDGTLASDTDGDNNTTTFANWYRGLPQTVGFADGTRESAVVNANGWITSITDPNGYTTNYAYDAMGRLARISYPAGDDVTWNPTVLSFTQVAGAELGIPGGHWKQAAITGNDTTVTYFDAFWRPLITEHYDAGNPSGTLSQVVTNYDAGGRTVFQSYPTAAAASYTQSLPGTHTTYDALDRVTGVTQDSALGPLPTMTQYLAGFRTEVTDPRGFSTTTGYQAFGTPTTQWPVSIAAPQGVVTTIQRDVFGKPLAITRTGSAAGSPSLSRVYAYNGYQQLCKRVDPESGATAFGYDGAGNLAWSAAGLDLPADGNCYASTAMSSGRVATRTHDQRNRLLTVMYPGASGDADANFTYYPDGALHTQTLDNSGVPVTTTYTYDERRLLTNEALTIGNAAAFTLAYGHDANGHLASTTYPDGRVVDYAPNALGQPTAAGTYATDARYYPNGAIAGFTYGNGIVHTMTESVRGFVGHSTDLYQSTSFHDDTYTYDGDDNVAAITTPGNTEDVTMSYDGLDRLTEADSPLFEGNGKALYTYDVLGNLLSASVGNYSNVAYAYSNPNDAQLVALEEAGTDYVLHTYTYDLQGNLASRDGAAYQFDMADRLVGVPGIVSYLYDAAGRRVQKNELLFGGDLLDSDYSKAGQLLYQWDTSTQQSTDYIYLGDTLVARDVSSAASAPAPPAVPAAPASITATPASSSTGSFSVAWPASSGASTYVLWQNANGGGADSVYSGSATSHAVTGLASGRYVYQVQACNASGCSGMTTSGTVTVIPAPPASITVPAYSFSTSIPVSWPASDLASNYALEEYPYEGGWGVAYNGPNTSYTATVPGSGVYRFQVTACGEGGCSTFTSSGNVTVTLAPSLSASTTASLNGTFTLSWGAVSTATSYTLSQNGTAVYTGNGTSWPTNNLADGSYTYTVVACNADGCSGASNAVTVTVNRIAAPNLSAGTTSSANGTFSLSWNVVANATSYTLYQSGTASPVYTGSAMSWTSSGLPDGSYTYTLYGCNGSTCGFASNSVTVTVRQVAPSLTASTANSTTGSFTLNWNATTDATSYRLHQNGVLVYSASGTSWSASGLGNGNYAYTVQACNAAGCSTASNSATVTVLLVPPAPSLSVNETASSNGSFTLRWNATAGASSYTVQQSGASSATYNNVTGTSWTANLSGDGNYTYAVKACNASGCSATSNAVTVTVLVAPASVTAPPTVITGNPFVVSWSGVGGATGYTLRQTDTDTGVVKTFAEGGTSTTINGLVLGFYQYAVQACSAAGCSGWTNAPNLTDVESKGRQQAVPASGSSGP